MGTKLLTIKFKPIYRPNLRASVHNIY